LARLLASRAMPCKRLHSRNVDEVQPVLTRLGLADYSFSAVVAAYPEAFATAAARPPIDPYFTWLRPSFFLLARLCITTVFACGGYCCNLK
jgi:hypothetical protein